MSDALEINLGPLEPMPVILDLCAGGEGIIARAYPGRVIGVDQLLSEINQARLKCPPRTIFLVGDARQTNFVDNTFEHVTVFFGLMYVKGGEAKRALFAEAARVLRPGGSFHLWGTPVPPGDDVFGVAVTVTLPGGEVVRTGYGVRGEGREQNLETVRECAAAAGLEVQAEDDHGGWFYVRFTKPKSPNV
ncbi:MAG: class I SAM-dependent methyltransferase [Candidatus Zixiibacteriota bacterium]